MVNLTIREISATETEFNADDYIEIDGATDDTRKMLLSSLETQIRNGVNDTEMAILDGATLSTAELNILDGCTATYEELNYLAGLTPGTATASKALVLDSNKDGDLGRNLTASGTLAVAGAVTLAALLTCDVGITMLTGDAKFTGNDIFFDADGDSKFLADDDDILQVWLGGTEEYRADGSAFGCASPGANNLGGALNVNSATAANAWGTLNLAGGLIYAKAVADPGATTMDESWVIFMDSSTGNLMVRLQHGASEKLKTLSTF